MTAQDDLIIRIHGLAGARSACRVMGRQGFTLLSPPHAALSHGAQWFAELVDQARREFADAHIRAILDCQGHASGALAAFETGLDGVIVDPLPDVALDRLRNLGRKSGCTVLCEMPDPTRIYEMADDLLPDHELDRRLHDLLHQQGRELPKQPLQGT